MQVPLLQPYTLVGGTSLALQLGHRISVDLDLFGSESLDFDKVLSQVDKPFQPINRGPAINSVYIENVKVDVVQYPYPLIRNIIEIEGIRMASLEDIAAMKLSAIANRGAKKDFVDLALLLDQFRLSELLGFFEEKFSQEPPIYILKSLTYFEDAEDEFDPEMLIDFKWEDVKKKMAKIVDDYSRR